MGMSISNYTFRKLAIQLKINLCKFHTKSVKDDKLPIVFTFVVKIINKMLITKC